MIHQTLIPASQIALVGIVIAAFIAAFRMSTSVDTFLATVSWNG
jgi:hypothetical protein